MKRLFAFLALCILSVGTLCSQKRDSYQVRTVVIDPGHGGAKPGARGSRSYEKDITLAVAKKFGKLISDNYPDVKVIYTRTSDADISLAQRARIANSNKADLFISIHANSHPTSSPTGVETFVMGLSESRANLEVAKKENADILLEADYKNNADYSGFDPNAPETYVMLTMFQNAYIDKSLNFAQAIQSQYKTKLQTINRGVKQAELYVLYKTSMPSVLTEIGFISNPKEEAFMLSDEGQAKIAICLFNAFMSYKATEEGTNKILNPVINIKGYNQPDATLAEKAEPATEATPKPKTEPEPDKETKTETKAQPSTGTKAAESSTQTPVSHTPSQPQKPTPSPNLPPLQKTDEPSDVIDMPASEAPIAAKPAENPTATTHNDPKPSPQPSPEPPKPADPPKPAVREQLEAPVNTADPAAQQYYTVQFLTLNIQRKAGDRELEGISDFQTHRQGASYAHTTGRFRTRKEANAYCEHLKRATSFSDAWVYLYKVPEGSSQQPSAQPANNTSTQTVSTNKSASGLSFRIQFCSATRLMKAGDPDLHGISDFQATPSGRYYIYVAGNYDTRQEAEQRCRTIQNTTIFKDAYVIAYHNGKRISLEQAAALASGK